MSEHEPLQAVLRRRMVDREERHELGDRATVETSRSHFAAVTVVNLSRSGCLVKGCGPVGVGDEITIKLSGLDAKHAVVRRLTKEQGFACSFSPMLKPTEVHALLARAPYVDEMIGFGKSIRKIVTDSDREAAATERPNLLQKLLRRSR